MNDSKLHQLAAKNIKKQRTINNNTLCVKN